MWILVLIGAGILTGFINLAMVGFDQSVGTICSIFLLHQFVVTSGLIGIIGFSINVCVADKTAKQLNWPGGPFQVKYGFSQLGVGVMGILSIWFRGTFWVGTLVTLYIYGISGLCTHTMELKKKAKVDKIEVANIILDVIYHVVLTIMSLYVPGVWKIG